jgi:hypothetical protein
MHSITRTALAAAALAGAATLASCTDGYGRSGVSVGYNASWGDPYWGWYDNYYYPGTGFYVYTTDRRRIRWNDAQRGYWEGRRGSWRGDRRWRSNWREFRRRR